MSIFFWYFHQIQKYVTLLCFGTSFVSIVIFPCDTLIRVSTSITAILMLSPTGPTKRNRITTLLTNTHFVLVIVLLHSHFVSVFVEMTTKSRSVLRFVLT